MSNQKLEQFADDILQEVLAKAGITVDSCGETSSQLREEMFTEIVLELLEEHDEVDGWEICTYESNRIGPIPAAKLNAWSLSGDGATLDLFITLFHGTGRVEEIGKPDVRRCFELVSGFLKRALAGSYTRMEESSQGFYVAQSIFEIRESLSTVRLFFLTDGIARSLDIEPEKVLDQEVKYVAWDLEKLSNLHVGERGLIELDLINEYGGGIPCLETSDVTGEYRTFLSFFPAILLSRIYGEYGQRLLERNVRAFLQVKGKVNTGLQKTLKEVPHRFLAYNNGLCCTAADVRLLSNSNGLPCLAWIQDFQIVNGGQTTASIFHSFKREKRDLSSVMVQVKLTVISDPDQMSEIVPNISRYANSQNKVNGADFSANGKFHRDLEELSRTVWALASSGMERGSHWYYERARGSYLDDKARQGTPVRQKEWSRQNPPNQKFTKTDLAKYEHAWLGLPHLVSRGAEKNFEEFAKRLEDDGEPNVDKDFFMQMVARAILWRTCERSFNELHLKDYRAQSVAYTLAWIAEQSGRRLDLGRIWHEQGVSDILRSVLTTVLQDAHKFITSLGGNEGEGCKRPETWMNFRDHRINVGKEWQNEWNENSSILYPPKRTSAQVQEDREKVGQLSANDWFALSKWSKERGFLEPWERSLSFSIGKLLAKGAMPSDKQNRQGARIIARAIELGFSPKD